MLGMVCLAAVPVRLAAQAASALPQLKQRASENEDAPPPEWARLRPGRTGLPVSAWGEYAFGAPGEVLELDLQDGRLTGYISRRGGADTDRETMLTYFFDRSTIEGTRVTFSTRAIHGVWFSFAGEIARGEDDRRTGAPGYVLTGTMTEHVRADATVRPERVSLKKIPLYGAGR